MACMVPTGGSQWVCIGAQSIRGGCATQGANACRPGGGCGPRARAPDLLHHDYVNRTLPARVIAYDRLLAATQPVVHALLNTNTGLEFQLRAELRAAGGGTVGDRMVTRFMQGTGGTLVHGTGSPLAGMASISAHFTPAVTQSLGEVKARLATQTAGPRIQFDLEMRTVPWLAFPITNAIPWRAAHERTLAAAIGGTKGFKVFVRNLQVNTSARTFSATFRFEICDHFGVDETDLYSPGLFAFWKLQHARSGPQAPFSNLIAVEVNLSASF